MLRKQPWLWTLSVESKKQERSANKKSAGHKGAEPVERAGVLVWTGTAIGQAGQVTAQRIVDVTRQQLIDEGSNTFSMRNVAAQAGLRLGNLQYYFPTRDDLLRALFADTAARYQRTYERLLADAPPDREAGFRTIARFCVMDVANPPTKRYFLQFWTLLDKLDGPSATRLAEYHRYDIAQLSDLITALAPGTRADEIRQRATLVAALIEGFLVVRSAYSEDTTDFADLENRAVATIVRVALGETC